MATFDTMQFLGNFLSKNNPFQIYFGHCHGSDSSARKGFHASGIRANRPQYIFVSLRRQLDKIQLPEQRDLEAKESGLEEYEYAFLSYT